MNLEKYYLDSFLVNRARLERALLREVKNTVNGTPDKKVVLCYEPSRVLAFTKGGFAGEVYSLEIRNGHMFAIFARGPKAPMKDVQFNDVESLVRNVVAATKTPSALVSVIDALLGKPLKSDPLDQNGFVLKSLVGRRNNAGYPDTLVFETEEGGRKELSKKELRELYEHLMSA